MILFNIIGSFYIGFPKINFNHAVNLQLSREFPTISLMLYFPVIGFMYLVSTSVSFSIVFFYLVAVVQEGITNRIGYDVTRPDAFVWGMQSLSWQAWGGFTALVAAASGGHCSSPAVDDPTHCVFGLSGMGGQECDYALWRDCGLSPSAAVFHGIDRRVFLGDWARGTLTFMGDWCWRAAHSRADSGSLLARPLVWRERGAIPVANAP